MGSLIKQKTDFKVINNIDDTFNHYPDLPSALAALWEVELVEKGRHLNYEERQIIENCVKKGYDRNQIIRILDRSKETVYAELRNFPKLCEYTALAGQQIMFERKHSFWIEKKKSAESLPTDKVVTLKSINKQLDQIINLLKGKK